jgi:hypothetical protein
MSSPVVVATTVGVVSVPVEVETELLGEPPGIETVGESLDERPPVTVLAAATPASRRIAEMITAAFVMPIAPFEYENWPVHPGSRMPLQVRATPG